MTVRAALDRDGFAIVRNLLDPCDIAAIAAAFDDLLSLARTLSGPSDVHGSRFVVEPEPFRLHRVVWCGGASPTLAAFGHDPRVLAMASAALDSAALVQLIQQAHFKLPGDEVDFPLHQDASNRRYGTDEWVDVNGRGSFIQLAFPVDGMGPENGGIQLIPGSHRQGFIADPRTGALPDEALRGTEPVTPRLHPGDALLFGPFTIHGSGPNRSAHPRRLFVQGYALPGANGRHYPGCGLGQPRHHSGTPTD